jgi:DNA (cytosine-5)-methyltransferase 1
MSLKVGALFAGYGGLELALASVLNTQPAWFSEFDKAPSAILAHHWPDVPNLGDVTKIDWATVEPVDIITGGSPCQDLSHAGKRAGMKAGTRSGLWASMCDAIDIIRPRLVVWENVRGALSAEADSGLEQCPRCVGDPRDTGPVLRALGRVVGDLADLGYVGQVRGLRAADVGAAHGRFRVFLFATPADAGSGGGLEAFERYGRRTAGVHGSGVPDESDRDALRSGPDGVPGQLTLLPTPAVNDMGAAYTPETWDAWTERMKSEHSNGNGHGKSLNIEALRLLPTPGAIDGGGGPKRIREDGRTEADHGPALRDLAGHAGQIWGEYEAAIRRWENAIQRPAPAPTEPGKNGSPRLSPKFVEWLMGLPEGHVTDPAIGISRNDQLKALGNGVVPQQCAAALRAFLNDTSQERAA